MAADPIADKRERERLALEAQRLTNDETLKTALTNIRKEAVNALISADANKITDVVRLQAKVSVCDEFMAELENMILLKSLDDAGSRIV